MIVVLLPKPFRIITMNSRNQNCVTEADKPTGPNPTTSIYNASVNFYNATGSLARFENKKYFILL
jgi:hypothetical protein